MPKSGQAQGIDVGYVANLARLRLSDEEIVQFQAQLDQVVRYVESLSAVDIEGVEPMAHAVTVQNVFREDAAREGLDPDEVLANAPASHQGQFSVPRIME
jgi:aspartyl-tRNA(Asn)/glutamyl-tRNA(Gln) amidotransferase subunit C